MTTVDSRVGASSARRASSGLSAREAQLLTVTLEILHETGYDRLTVDEVVARAHASKSTVYRRWPSKADLVVAAFAHGIRQIATVPDTGSLRGDLLHLGSLVLEQALLNGPAIGGILPEIRRSPKLRAVLEHEFFHERQALVRELLERAIRRGEIEREAISDELWDLIPGYLAFRVIVPGRLPSSDTVRALVDDVMIPSLTRRTS